MAYFLRRVVQLLIVLLVISLVSFLLMHLTGDPALFMLGQEATPEALQEFREEWGLDDPLPVQFTRYVGNALKGDFGQSLRYRESTLSLFLERLPATLLLAGTALAISVVVGGVAGLLAAVYRGTRFDTFVRLGALVGQAVPGFYLGLVAMIIFGAQLQWLPTGGTGSFAHLILPAGTLAVHYIAIVARFVRGSMLEIIRSDYVRTARAKGLSEGWVMIKHALRNALVSVVTLVGMQAGTLLSGAVVTETVFSWPGIGRMAVQAIYTRDFPLVQLTILMTAAIFVVVNLLTDIVYTVLDPRIRLEGS